MNKKEKSFYIPESKKTMIIFGAILAIVLYFYYFLYINKMLPSSEGWGPFYVELMKSGKFPYRDFYFYLPPLNLIIDYIFYSIADGMLGYRILRLIERIFMMEILYKMLCKRFSPHLACLGCIIGGIMGSFPTYDLMGDYNQTVVLSILILGYFALKFIENINKKRKFRYIFFAGIIIGLQFTIKQTAFVSACISFFLLLTIYCIIEKDKDFKLYVFYTFLGAILPILICCCWLLINNAFFPFIEQVFMGSDSKGGLLEIIIVNICYHLFGKENQGYLLNFTFFVVSLGILAFIRKHHSRLAKSKLFRNVILCFLILCIFEILYSHNTYLQNIILVGQKSKLLFSFILLFLPFCFFIYQFKQNILITKLLTTLLFLVPNGLLIYCILTNKNQITPLIAKSLVGSSLSNEFAKFAVFFSFFYIIYLFIYRIKKGSWNDKLYLLILTVTCFCNNYSTVMAAAKTDSSVRNLFIFIPIIFCILQDYKIFFNKLKNVLIYLSTSIVILFSFAEKVECPYSWWGWVEEPLYNKTETVDINFAQGFLFSEREKNIYEEVTKLITENSSPNETVYTFPHHKLLNHLSNRLKMDTFVPVPFYDVCNDKYASLDAELLKQHPPQIVVWCDMLDCIDVHENFFRNGNRSGQRDIQEWLYQKTNDGTYICIGQVENLFVFYLSNGKQPNYTFWENENAICHTLLEKNLRLDVAVELQGKGTQEDPYQINHLKDFINFRDCVNNGYSFSGEFVSLNCDLDLSSIENWIPVGEFDSGRYFYGTFDGNGYTINHLTIKGQNNSGLFGQLGGHILNLSLIDFYIEGTCIGGIASHSINNPSITNCYTTGTAIASSRAGGIADNFSGGIISNCYTNCTLEAPLTASIVSYNALKISNCITTNSQIYSDFFSGSCTDSVTLLSSSQIIETLNQNQEKIIESYQTLTFHQWTSIDGKITLSTTDTNTYKANDFMFLIIIIISILLFCIYICYCLYTNNKFILVRHCK